MTEAEENEDWQLWMRVWYRQAWVSRIPWVSISVPTSLRLRLGAPGTRVPLIVPQGGCLMHYNEPHNIPWWHGGDFGVVTSPTLSTVCITHMWSFSSGPTIECVVYMLHHYTQYSLIININITPIMTVNTSSLHYITAE